MQLRMARSRTSTFRSKNWLMLFYVLLFHAPRCNAICYSPPTFGSFNGRPAQTLNDCTWDFFSCTHQNDSSCCQNRFDMCCKCIMDNTLPMCNPPIPITTPTPPPTTITSIVPPTCPFANSLAMCVWKFNSCIQRNFDQRTSEKGCYKCFNQCKMYVMGPMTMQDNSVNEIPKPFMSAEPTKPPRVHTSTTTEDRPTIAQCLWMYFKCNEEDCKESWNKCMDDAMMDP